MACSLPGRGLGGVHDRLERAKGRAEASGCCIPGEKQFLIPVDTIRKREGDHVYVDQDHERVAAGPEHARRWCQTQATKLASTIGMGSRRTGIRVSYPQPAGSSASTAAALPVAPRLVVPPPTVAFVTFRAEPKDSHGARAFGVELGIIGRRGRWC
jgi:hypothetical protein